MPPDIERFFQSALTFFFDIRQEIVPWLAAGDNKTPTWARRIESYSDVPETFKAFFDALPAGLRTPFPCTVLTPTFEGFIHPEPERLICLAGDRIHVLEKTAGGFSSLCYPIEDISYVETGTILLSSWITIHGLDESGRISFSTLRFNSITDHLFAPIVKRIRSASGGAQDADPGAERARFDALARSNYKFMNFGRKSIRPGEKVIRYILQPEIRSGSTKALDMLFSRPVSTAHLSILTDCELILIRDDEHQRVLRGSRYGGIWRFVPLNKVTSVSLTGRDGDLLELSVHLPEDQHIESLFPQSRQGEVELLFDEMKMLAAG